jgi:hypothetical protein
MSSFGSQQLQKEFYRRTSILKILPIAALFLFSNFVFVSSVSYSNVGNNAFSATKTSIVSGSNFPTITACAGTSPVEDKEIFLLDSDVHLIPRGGDIGGITATNIAKFYSGLVSLDALSGTFFPSATCQLAGVKVLPKSIRRLTVQAVGGAAGSLFISSFLAVTDKVSSTEKSIAYGLLSQIFFLLRGIITNPSGLATLIPRFKLKIDLLLYASSIVISLFGLLPKHSALMLKAVIGYKFFDSLTSYFMLSKKGIENEGMVFALNNCGK